MNFESRRGQEENVADDEQNKYAVKFFNMGGVDVSIEKVYLSHIMKKPVLYHMSHITWKRVFGDFQPGKIQTSVLSYRS